MTPTAALSGKRVRDLFYTQDIIDANMWLCRCGKKRKVTGTGFTNLVNHVRELHPEEFKQAQQGAIFVSESVGSNNDNIRSNTLRRQSNPCSPSNSEIPTHFLWKKNTIKLHGWLEYIIHNLCPFSSCEKEDLARHIRYDRVSLKTLLKYVDLLTKSVEQKISNILPDKFALMFDGWSTNDAHYIGIFAVFASNHTHGYSRVLLGLTPLENEQSQSSNEHYELFCFILDLFGKSVDNVVALIGDNCATNRSLSRLFECGFVGCASHRFNLAVKDLMSDKSDIINNVRELMKKLRNPKRRAQLRNYTNLSPLVCNDTRWSSTYEMLRRYIEVKEHLPQLHVEEIDDLIPSRKEHDGILDLCKTLGSLDSVTKCLQKDSTTISEVRALFDTVIIHYPTTEPRLGPTANIVENPEFESALVKIQRGTIRDMDGNEEQAVKKLCVSSPQSPEPEAQLSLADIALKTHFNSEPLQEYGDVRFILPTTNGVERLFSKCRQALTDYRKCISPTNFEAQLFLHANRDLWSLNDVNNIVD